MILDTSALVAVLLREEGSERLLDKIAAEEQNRLSAANLTEFLIVIGARHGAEGVLRAKRFLAISDVTIEPLTEGQAELAADAYRRYGKGFHTARLNMGDCYAYALAKTLEEPLLFVGQDFAKTDVNAAITQHRP